MYWSAKQLFHVDEEDSQVYMMIARVGLAVLGKLSEKTPIDYRGSAHIFYTLREPRIHVPHYLVHRPL